ncbi:type II toxin-antitoxin system RelE/ParE family toxin [Pseudomonas sp. C1C7]|uniref:type II toxin-antitoxin system RelE/ParE family toxin n=1 Tax=Pseudomonas sp. C1C7 TaxID=2735272 RepID=UPI001586E3F2|nr:type II toxin-antitoxin system RelE/ParE family toxin [Pseudomonas sp. C1C7]
MRQLLFAALARDDLLQIARFIARDNPERARTFVGELRMQCSRLSDQPSLGVSREDCAKGLRMLAHGRYLIFYCLIDDGIKVERVLHSARDISRLFDKNSIDH